MAVGAPGFHHDEEAVHDPFDTPESYYSKERAMKSRRRGYSQAAEDHGTTSQHSSKHFGEMKRIRRASLDSFGHGAQHRQFLVNVNATLEQLMATEDTDGNHQITIEDGGPKVLALGTANSNGHNRHDVRGTYALANLMQELFLAKEHGRRNILLDEARLTENPVSRMTRLIKTVFWKGLTRRIDASVIEIVTKDEKAMRMKDPRPRIYVPYRCHEQLEYYKKVAEEYPDLNLDVVQLPEIITAEYTKSINDQPGLLALAMEKYVNDHGEEDLRGYPFVVPGGRFNELYGWDSYFMAIGLILDGEVNLAKSMVINFCFEIEHYGKILNANRSYYLSRSQPPFLTDMALRVYKAIKHEPGAIEFLRTATLAAMKEYFTVWMASPRYDPITGLSRYRPDGLGVPPETEPEHFDSTLRPFAEKHNMDIPSFIEAYNDGIIKEPELDEWFLHDRAVRESGHDTTYRFEGVCANLATIDLNSLLYKYEVDLARIIRDHFKDRLEIPKEFSVPGIKELQEGFVSTSASWDRRARVRKKKITQYLWNAEKGMYFDYDTAKRQQTDYESATVFWAMWAGVCDPRQATKLVDVALPKFEKHGGLACGTEQSRGELSIDRPNRQWDYPYGWAPQQMLAWIGLQRYGYHDEVNRLAYRWLSMMTKAFVDYHGVVVEKYDVTRPTDPHRVDAEYGNQGSDFRGVAREGFGWANASFQLGLTFLGSHAKRALGACIPPDRFLAATRDEQEALLEDAGASPASTPDSELDSDPFNGLPPPTPAAAVVQDPFERAGTLQFRTPAATPAAKDIPNPLERVLRMH